MKTSLTLLFAFILALTSCKKGDVGEQGEQGPPGPQGTQGPQGVAGNANAMQYTFGVQNLSVSYSTLQITTTADTMNRSTWLVYLYYQPITRWYFLPGYGYAGATQYRVSMEHNGGKVYIYIDKSGAGENYAQAKVVRIYNSGTMAGGRSNSSTPMTTPDLSDYEAVRKYYGIPD